MNIVFVRTDSLTPSHQHMWFEEDEVYSFFLKGNYTFPQTTQTQVVNYPPKNN